ncbi:hypothetical protein [Pedobacter sp. Leaf132]|uniref:hypothetical protein n=1 Tax=Pedobacter sp. Leaf132 TaxID=2876557 RepID=UPI001E37A24D|nr:hypothetical protein [Pedobacter sp. Leaf132]
MKATAIEIESKITPGFKAKLSNSMFFTDAKMDNSTQIKNDLGSVDYLLKCKNNLKNALSLASALVV